MDDAALSREMLPGRTTGPDEPARPVRRCDPRSRAGEHVFTACDSAARRAIPRKRGPKPDRSGNVVAHISSLASLPAARRDWRTLRAAYRRAAGKYKLIDEQEWRHAFPSLGHRAA